MQTSAQRPLAVLACQGLRPLQPPLRVQQNAVRAPQATARQQRRGGQQVLCSAAADKPVNTNGAPATDFKAWESVITSVKQRDDIKTIMLFGAGPIVIGQVRRSLRERSERHAPRRSYVCQRACTEHVSRSVVNPTRPPSWPSCNVIRRFRSAVAPLRA